MSKHREDPEKQVVYSPGEIIGKEVFEQVTGGQYVIWHMEKHAFALAPEGGRTCYETPTIIYYPLRVTPWPTARLPTKTVEHEDLWQQVHDFIYKYVDLPDGLLYDVLTAWTFATYIREKLKVVPYLFVYGPLSSGKTWLLEVLQKICYRGIIGSNVSAAALYRGIEKFHPTTFLDETEIYSIAEKSEVVGLLNSGYRKGQYAWRVKNTEQGSEIEFFDVFGFKALAGTEKMKDTLESRSIIIRMMKNRRAIPLHIDERQALDLRNKLLNWRFRKLSDISDICDVILEDAPLGSSNQRIDELFESLLLVSNKGKENIVKYAKKLDEEWQNREETSIEAEILEFMLECEDSVENNVLLTKTVTEKFNADRSDKEKWKTRSVGRLISRLGFTQKRMAGSGKRGWYWDPERIEYLKQRYGMSSEKTSLTSQTSEAEWTCKFCGKPGSGLYDKIFGPQNEQYKAHFDCARQWRVNKGYEEA